MTTTNVTDATLKGHVSGPTFTGDVDGAKFTGSVTYADTTPPDPTPPDQIPIPEARITNFSNKNETSFNIDGKSFWVETPGKSWSLSLVDDRTLRFEVRSGDRFMSSYYNDPTTSERCEVSSQAAGALVPPNGTLLLQHRMMWEAGSVCNANWSCFSQMHEVNVSNSPPYSIGLGKGTDKMDIDIGTSQQQFVYKDTQPIVRGKWYTIQTEAKWDKNNGFLKVKRDGIQIVNYTGPLGTGVGHYLKFGVYRNESPETVAIQYRDVSLKVT